ncbi:hypothetical protein JK231_24990 [Pantoea sp. JGM49]|uniref:hypothetical protein n=1 Tax=Pantoea sp. JGM49 TaxID=2799791 RepID=UPI001BA5D234|nr:hypothetical protein [Pantoea sp. JGM49]MBS0883847.1 hypothetical protein [Pantoea sp. JGM49]
MNAASRPLFENGCEKAAEYGPRYESALRRHFLFPHVRQPGERTFGIGGANLFKLLFPAFTGQLCGFFRVRSFQGGDVLTFLKKAELR